MVFVNRLVAFLLLAATIQSCSSDNSPVVSNDAIIEQWLQDLGISASRSNEVYYYPDSLNPSGNAVVGGSVVAIYYTVTDLQGTTLASRPKSGGDSVLGKVGSSAIFPVELDQNLTLMREGEVYNFIFPPSVAYGKLSGGTIPTDEPILLNIEIARIISENDLFSQDTTAIANYIAANMLNNDPLNPVEKFPSGIATKRVVAGTGSQPINGDTLIINYEARFLNDQVFQTRNGFEYVFGSGFPAELLPGFQFVISQMLQSERTLALIPSSQAYRESVLYIPESIGDQLVEDQIIPEYAAEVDPYRALIFEITRVR